MYLAVKKQGKNTAGGVHLALVSMDKSGQIIWLNIQNPTNLKDAWKMPDDSFNS
jgi:hypothetical protein